MVKWTSKEKELEAKIRYAVPMVKRKTSGECKVCKKEIFAGENCFYYEIEVKGLQYPVRRYVCVKCHDEIASKPVDDSVTWLIHYFGEHYDNLEL